MPSKNIKGFIVSLLKTFPGISSREIHEKLDKSHSYATVKRVLQTMLDENLIINHGKGKATRYQISQGFSALQEIDVSAYFEKEIDERSIQEGFNQSFISDILPALPVFTKDELTQLGKLHETYTTNTEKLSSQQFAQEMERLAIDLSWKSAQIEGNTYSLLETERLLRDKETAAGKTKDEAVMLLNHKAAIDFIIAEPNYVSPLTVRAIEDIHSLLIKDLGVDRNMRKHRVGISGTNYKPLDNEFQIREALEAMCSLTNTKVNIFEKAFLVLVLISYIQAFADGNKRTARIISNAILIDNRYCPLSFRTVDSIDYKKAMLIFYETNNLSAFKKIFIHQYAFAVNTYF